MLKLTSEILKVDINPEEVVNKNIKGIINGAIAVEPYVVSSEFKSILSDSRQFVEHPLISGVKTRPRCSLIIDWYNFILFTDSAEHNTWVLVQNFNAVDVILLESGVIRLFTNPDLEKSIEKFFHLQEKLTLKNFETSWFQAVLIHHNTPFHFFYDQLYWFWKSEDFYSQYSMRYGRDYRSVMPTNLYGPNDNFHPENSHVIPALLRRFHEAKQAGAAEVVAWGTGSPMREFLHVDDMAAASVHVMNLDTQTYQQHTQPMLSHINVGTGVDCTIKELTETVARVVGFAGDIVWDTRKPDGTPRKLMDVSRLKALGWQASIGLEDGLRDAYQWFLQHQEDYRG